MFEVFSPSVKPATALSLHQTPATGGFKPAQKAPPASAPQGGETPSPKTSNVCGSTGQTPPGGLQATGLCGRITVPAVGAAQGSPHHPPGSSRWDLPPAGRQGRSRAGGRWRRSPPGAGEPDPQPRSPAGGHGSAAAGLGQGCRSRYGGPGPSGRAGGGKAASAPGLTRRTPRASFLLPSHGSASEPPPPPRAVPDHPAAQAGPGPPPPTPGRGPAIAASALPPPGPHRQAPGRPRSPGSGEEEREPGGEAAGGGLRSAAGPSRGPGERGEPAGPHLAPSAPLPPLPRAAPRPAPPETRAAQPISARRRRHRRPMNRANASPPSTTGRRDTPFSSPASLSRDPARRAARGRDPAPGVQ